jgi:hypothetical protein
LIRTETRQPTLPDCRIKCTRPSLFLRDAY